MLAIMSPGFWRAAVCVGQQGQRLVVQAVRSLGLKAHEGGETVGIRALQQISCAFTSNCCNSLTGR